MGKIENLFNALREDEGSVFYAADQPTRNLLSKARKSHYAKDKAFVNIYNENKQQESYSSCTSSSIPLTTPFIPQKSSVNCSTLYSFKGPFEALQADIADTRFLAKSAVNPLYCLLVVGLFTNYTYTYPMKKRTQLALKLANFYADIKSQRELEGNKRMRLQTDLELKN